VAGSLLGGRFRYSDLKEATPAVRQLCDLNGTMAAGCGANAVLRAVVEGIRAGGLRRRVVARNPVAALGWISAGVSRAQGKGFLFVPKDAERAQPGQSGHATHLIASGGGTEQKLGCGNPFDDAHGCPADRGNATRIEVDQRKAALPGGLSSVRWRKSSKQMGSRLARRRLARKPRLRMRTKPRGNTCRRKRRRNSSTDNVIGFFLLPCAESRHRKVTWPWSSVTSLWLEMATRWV